MSRLDSTESLRHVCLTATVWKGHNVHCVPRRVFKGRSYFDTVAHVVQQRVVDRLADVAHRPLHVARGDDLVGARSVLVCGQDTNLATRHLLLVNVHSLR